MTEEEMRTAKDWKAQGAVAPIRQQKCGDCYTFSAISALESAYWIKTRRMTYQSEQKLVDCSSSYGFGQGCGGGCEYCAFNALRSWYSVTSGSYPYANGKQQACNVNRGTGVTKTRGYTRVAKGENNLMRAVLNRPVTAAVEASADF
jgi:C1A family cysteine protease